MTTPAPICPSSSPRRKQPAPSARNQQIYLDYQTAGCRQTDLAAKYGLTQCRISQIIRRVEKWLHATFDFRPSTFDHSARQALERRLQHDRASAVAREAMRHFKDQQKSITHKSGTRADKQIDETTERLLPPNLQCLKVVLQANAQLSRLDKQLAEEQSQPPKGDNQSRKEIENWLTKRLLEAEQSGKVEPVYNPRFLVERTLSALLGEAKYRIDLRDLIYRPSQETKQPESDEVPPDPCRTEHCSVPPTPPATKTSTSSTMPLPAYPPQPLTTSILTHDSPPTNIFTPTPTTPLPLSIIQPP